MRMKTRETLRLVLALLLLLWSGAVTARTLTEDERALIEATERNDVETARRLIAAGTSVNAQDEKRDSAFLLAGARGRLEILKLALQAGADLKSTNRYGGTALIPACHHGHVETVRELLKTAIDVNHVNRLGWTALLETVILGDGGPTYIEIARLLVRHGADVHLPDNQGVTPLGHARQRGQREIASILEAAGAR
jgi:ankyrin repeat protein